MARKGTKNKLYLFAKLNFVVIEHFLNRLYNFINFYGSKLGRKIY